MQPAACLADGHMTCVLFYGLAPAARTDGAAPTYLQSPKSALRCTVPVVLQDAIMLNVVLRRSGL